MNSLSLWQITCHNSFYVFDVIKMKVYVAFCRGSVWKISGLNIISAESVGEGLTTNSF